MGWYGDLNESIDEMYGYEVDGDSGFFKGFKEGFEEGITPVFDLLTPSLTEFSLIFSEGALYTPFYVYQNFSPKYRLYGDLDRQNTISSGVSKMIPDDLKDWNGAGSYPMKIGFYITIERPDGTIASVKCGTNISQEDTSIGNQPLRVNTEELQSKEDCQAVIDGTLDQYRLIYPEQTKGLSDDELCIVLFDSSYDQVVSELWGHASPAGQTIDFLFVPGDKTSDADISATDDDTILREVEKNGITVLGGGPIDFDSK